LTAKQHPAKSHGSRKHAKREKEPWLLVVSPSLKAYSAVQVVDYYRNRMQIEEGFRDTKSTHYGLDLASENRIDTERRANLLLIAALVTFALWLTGSCLKGTDIERQIKVNSTQNHSPYSVIFLARIACRYVVFVLSGSMFRAGTRSFSRLLRLFGRRVNSWGYLRDATLFSFWAALLGDIAISYPQPFPIAEQTSPFHRADLFRRFVTASPRSAVHHPRQATMTSRESAAVVAATSVVG